MFTHPALKLTDYKHTFLSRSFPFFKLALSPAPPGSFQSLFPRMHQHKHELLLLYSVSHVVSTFLPRMKWRVAPSAERSQIRPLSVPSEVKLTRKSAAWRRKSYQQAHKVESGDLIKQRAANADGSRGNAAPLSCADKQQDLTLKRKRIESN